MERFIGGAKKYGCKHILQNMGGRMVLGILALVPTFPGRSLPTHPQKFIGAQRLRTLNQPAPISRQWSKPFKIFRSEKGAGGEKEQG